MEAATGMKGARGNTSTPFSDTSRAPSSLSIDPRAPTPALRYGENGGSMSARDNYSSRPALSSRTPTPQQWAREYALRGQSSELPARSATALGGPLQPLAPLEGRKRQGSLSDVRPKSEQGPRPGAWSQDIVKSADSESAGSRQPAAQVGSQMMFMQAGSYEELFHRSPPTAEELDDMRPVRSRPMPPERSPTSARNPRSAGILSRSLGGVPRGPPNPITPPPQMAPPTVRPHNAWRTQVEWVPPCGSHEDPDFGYALICRTVGSEHSIVVDDLGDVPHACFDHLEPGLSYFFQVCACNCRGWGDWSNPSSPHMVPEPPGRPNGKPFDYADKKNLGTFEDGRPLSSSEFTHQATLYWDEPCSHGSQITGYNVEYSLNPADPHMSKSVTCMNRGTSVEITDLLPNRVYYLRTQATNSVGTSDWTPWSAGVATKATPPEQMEPPRMLEFKPHDLLIGWSPPFSCGFRITKYSVRISETPTMERAFILPGEATAGHVDDDCKLRVVDLAANVPYYFQVRAENEIGISEWSQTSEAIKTMASVPSACSHVEVTSNIYQKMEVQWRVPETCGLPITSFVVRRLKAEHPMKEQSRMDVPAIDGHNAAGNKMSSWVSNIPPGSRLVFQVAAKSDAGIGAFSEISDIVVACAGKPGVPRAPVVKLRTGTSIVVQAEDKTEENGAPITTYECRWDTLSIMANAFKITGSMKEVERQAPGLPRIYEIAATGLVKRGPYFFSVRAENRIGWSQWSPPSEPMLLHFVGPSKMCAPHESNEMEKKDESLMIGYTPSAEMGMTQGGNVSEYEMRYSRWRELLDQGQDAEGDTAHEEVFLARWPAKKATREPPPPQLIESMLTGRSYHFQVRAVTDNGTGPWSDISPAFEVLPSKPENPQAPQVQLGTDGPYSIQLSITLPECNGRRIEACSLKMYGPIWDDQHGCPEWVDLYTIKHIDVNEERRHRAPIRNDSEPGWETVWHHTVIHLEAGAYYQFMCTCENTVGCSEWSEASVAIATAATAPSRCQPPYLEKEEDRTHNSLRVVWEAPHNGGAPITEYSVCWATNPRFQGYKTIECAEPQLSLPRLEPYQWYYLKVAAVNSVGKSRYSDFDSANNIGCFLTLATVPTVVTNICAEIQQNESVVVKWGKPECSGGHMITKYKVIASTKIAGVEKIEFQQQQKASRECYLKDLAPDTDWFFEVLAGTSVGFGPLTEKPGHVHTHVVEQAKAILPPNVAVPECTIRASKGGTSHLEVNWKCPELYDKKKGFIYKTGIQTHMILSYKVRIMAGQPLPEQAEQLIERDDIKQVRDRRTVPKDEHNMSILNELLPGRFYTAMVLAESEAGLSDWSEVSTGVWSTATMPDMPTGFELVDREKETLTLQWVCPNGNGADLTGFRVRWKYKRSTNKRLLHTRTYEQDGCKTAGCGASLSLECLGKDLPALDRSLTEPSTAADKSMRAITTPHSKTMPADVDSDSSGSGWDDDDDDLGNMLSPDDDDFHPDTGIHGMELSLQDCKFGPEPPVVDDAYAPRGQTHFGQMCRWQMRKLTPGRFYVAEVRCVNSVGNGAWAHSGHLRTASNVPDPPTNLRGLPETATQTGVSFCWEMPKEVGGEPVDGFEVAWMRLAYRAAPPSDTATILADGNCQERIQIAIDTCTFRAEGLLPGNMAIPIVRCWNSVGFSGWCTLGDTSGGRTMEEVLAEVAEELAAKPSPPSPVIIPPVLEKGPSSDHRPVSLTASWKCPELCGWPVKYFLLKICLSGDPPPLTDIGTLKKEKEMRLDHDGVSPDWHEGDDVSLKFVHEGLIPGAPYILNVRACTGEADVGDCMDWGAVSRPELAPPDYPLQPLAPSCPWRWPDALQIEWQEPCMSGAPQTRCDARYSRASDMSNLVQVSDVDLVKSVQTKSVLVGGLKYTTDYFFQLRIANEVGWSPWSQVSPAFLTKACRPAAPDVLQSLDVQKENLTLRWDAPSDHGAIITQYDVVLVDGPKCDIFPDVVKKANACNYVEGEEFNEETADAAVWKLLNTTIELKAKTRIEVQDASDPNASVSSFTGLLGGIKYAAVVRACNKCGWSDWSTILSVVTPGSEPERCPQAALLQAYIDTVSIEYRLPYDNGSPITKLEFTWTRVTGPKDRHKARILGGRAEDHRYSASGTIFTDLSNGGPEAAPPYGIGGRGDVTLEGLEPGTEYDIQYRAENSYGFGPMSHVTRMLTAPGRPDAPENVRSSKAMVRGESPDSPALQQTLDNGEAPTVCFARTSRLQASEVVHVRQSSPRGNSPGTSARMIQNAGDAVPKINE